MRARDGDSGERIARLREDALAIFRAGVAAADPAMLVLRALAGDSGARVMAAARAGGEVRAIAIGKAACTMARAAAEALTQTGVHWCGMAAVNRENRTEVEGFEVLASGHPLPDAAGVEAAQKVARFAAQAREGDLTLVLVSGGGSAILPAPAPGISLEDKLAVTRRLLECGAEIGEINTVRKHLSSLKGGGLARLAAAGDLEALVLSDVIGDDLSTIASGPTVPDPTTFAGALAVLERRGILGRVPAAVRSRLEAGARGEVAETPKPGDPVFARASTRILGSNGRSLDAARREAERRGYRVEVLSRALTGEARDAGARFAARLEEPLAARASTAAVAVLAGGETTVALRGRGKGGRNQELALAMALAARAAGPWVFLSAGTDGIDGPTDAAGALVDAGTLARGAAAGADAAAYLERNDSYTYFERTGDLVITGATGTNVADLQVLLAGAR
jgi:hydroxypyruvate reductase